VTLTRPLAGATSAHYTFLPTATAVPFLSAIGSGPALAYHKAKSVATIHLWPNGGGSECLCSLPAKPFGEGSGLIKYLPTGETIGFPPNRCSQYPRGVLIDQRNPTCDLRAYVGGLSTCHHGWHLLDAEQEVPWQDQPLVYYKKFRIWFQEYSPATRGHPASHVQVIRHDWGIAADGDHAEYDVPIAKEGTPPKQRTHTITGTWVPVPQPSPDYFLVLSHHHCHAPTCLRLDMFNNDTGKLICRQQPVYGGTGHGWDPPSSSSHTSFPGDGWDEEGYIATPPCMWGSPAHGLERPPKMNGVTIRVVAITNNTYAHHGEMALPEISLVQGPLPY
jgi:hypothetical protein